MAIRAKSTKHPTPNSPGGGADEAEVIRLFENAEALFAAGDYASAAPIYAQVLKSNRQLHPALRQFGICQLHLGLFKQAITALNKYLKSQSDDSTAHALLAQAYLGIGQMSKAKSSIKVAIQLNQIADFYFVQATIHESLSEVQAAVDAYLRGLKLEPNRHAARINLGVLYKNIGQYDRAIVQYDRVLKDNPEHIAAITNLGVCHHAAGSYELALQFLDQAASRSDDTSISFNAGLSYQQLGLANDALAAFNDVLTKEPDHLDAKLQLAETRLTMGDFAAANSTLTELLIQHPTNAHAWYLKTTFKHDPEGTEALLNSLSELAKHRDLCEDDKVFLGFGLGKLCDEAQNYDQAFKHYSQANRIRYKRFRPAAKAEIAQLTQLQQPDLYANAANLPIDANHSQQPIFVVGMPRSGTTLVERIVANLSAAKPAGELDFFAPAITRHQLRIGEFAGLPKDDEGLSVAALATLRDAYLMRAQRVVGESANFIDKTPANFAYLPLIQRLFPNALIIHCRRHPLDTCLSIYFQLFEGLPYSFDLSMISRYYIEYIKFMQYIAKNPPPHWFDLDYELLVNDELSMFEMIRSCLSNAGFETRADGPNMNYAINTPSRWQARQPINVTRVNRWRQYDRHLKPVTENFRNEHIML